VTRTPGAASAGPYNTRRRTDTAERWAVRIATFLPRIVQAIAKHWLLLANTVLGIQALLPIATPVLMASGRSWLGQILYTVYSPLCHQLPERSFFLFGPQFAYTLQELEHLLGSDVPLRYIGNPIIGYKMAVCQRDFATYTAMWLAGLTFIPLRQRLRPLPLKVFVLLCLPIGVDGFGQLFGLWDSTPWRRVISGALFGIACIWLAYPHVEAGMKDVLHGTVKAPL
jgi:uncharacterized membrane protein